MIALAQRTHCIVFTLLAVSLGCGTTKTRLATEQLLVSDAVDKAVADIDFRPLAGQTVYFDTSYVKNIKGIGFVNAEYIISSLRQQLVAADCRLQERMESADYVVEARVGTMGRDGNEVVYGLPNSNGLTAAASLMPNMPPLPAIPEISVARKQSELGASKIAVFAYHRETKQPVWQSGILQAKSTAQDVWVFGIGPFQRGTIYRGTQFAGQRIRFPKFRSDRNQEEGPPVAYEKEFIFDQDRSHALTARRERLARRDTAAKEKLPAASAEQWLAPLQPRIVSPLESRLDWR